MGGVFLLATFEAVERLPIGDCTAIFFSSPVFTMMLSTCLLRDHCGLWRIMIGTFLMSGVVIISRPPGLFPPEAPLQEDTTWGNSTASSADWRALFVLDHEHTVDTQILDKTFAIVIAIIQPILSALLAIVTRSERISWLYFQNVSADRRATSITPCWSSGLLRAAS